MPPTVTTIELAEYFGVTPARIHALARRRGIHPLVPGRGTRPAEWAITCKEWLRPGKRGRPRLPDGKEDRCS